MSKFQPRLALGLYRRGRALAGLLKSQAATSGVCPACGAVSGAESVGWQHHPACLLLAEDLELLSEDDVAEWTAQVETLQARLEAARADTLPLAICRAALGKEEKT